MSVKPQVEEILSCLEGVERAQPKPFFTGRVIQRLHRGQNRTSAPVRFTWAFSLLIVLIALNLILFFSQFRSSDQAIRDGESTTPGWVIDYTENPGISIYEVADK